MPRHRSMLKVFIAFNGILGSITAAAWTYWLLLPPANSNVFTPILAALNVAWVAVDGMMAYEAWRG